MKNLFTLICLFFAFVSVSRAQGADGFQRFQEKAVDFYSGTFIGENGINWEYSLCRNNSPIVYVGIDKPRLVLKSDTDAEIVSSVISGGIGLLKINYTTFPLTPVNLDVYVNSTKVASLKADASENITSLASDNIVVNIDKPFYIRIKQADQSSGQVIIDKVAWSKFSSLEYGSVVDVTPPVLTNITAANITPPADHLNDNYHLFPNPAKEYVVIEMAENHNVSFKLFTLAGQVVLQELVKGSGQKINVNNLKEGLYIYKIMDDKGRLVTGKMIIR